MQYDHASACWHGMTCESGCRNWCGNSRKSDIRSAADARRHVSDVRSQIQSARVSSRVMYPGGSEKQDHHLTFNSAASTVSHHRWVQSPPYIQQCGINSESPPVGPITTPPQGALVPATHRQPGEQKGHGRTRKDPAQLAPRDCLPG